MNMIPDGPSDTVVTVPARLFELPQTHCTVKLSVP
jgi:hypothetical protein